MELRDTVAVVTGGASGIGRATAVALARAGTDVIVADIDDEGGRETTSLVEREGSKGLFIHRDVGSRRSVEALVERSISWQGHCELFVSNAAITSRGAPHEFSVEDWDTLLKVNLFASIWAMRAILPHLLQRGRGHLVFVSSGAGLRGIPNNAPYSVSKFAIIGLAESLAMYLKGSGVKVSVVLPGAVGGSHNMWRTMRIAGADRMAPEEVERIREEHRAVGQGWPSPESMANTIVDGIRAGRFYIFQEGQGEYEDWALKEMEEKWRDPDTFVLGDE